MAKERKDVVVSLSDPAVRPGIEAARGIERDQQGRIVRSKDWLKERLAHLDTKETEFKKRLKNLQAERKQRQSELKKAK